MSPVVITIAAVFVGTAALCAWGAIALLSLRRDPVGRLAKFNGETQTADVSSGLLKSELLQEGAEGLRQIWQTLGIRPRSVSLWLAQAELPFDIRWLLFTGIAATFGLLVLAKVADVPILLYPLALLGAVLPLGYVVWRRKQRLRLFSQQLPDALELMASALRAGNTVQSAMMVISDEMLPPISREFETVSESIKLGIAVEQALDEMAVRVPNPDLQFFVTAVAMQRQCGGDLSEILDKISWIIRERFAIQGQVQALTGEGRLSGMVLMALPVFLAFVVYALNPDYVMLLVTDPLGHKMLAVAAILQLLGALAIRHIVNIKI